MKRASESYEEARRAYERGDYPLAQAKLLVAANQGDPAAQELLGLLYVLGPSLYPGVARDLAAAAFWFERAARSGSSASRYLSCALESARHPGMALAPLEHELEKRGAGLGI